MKRLLLVLAILVFVLSACGVGVSDYDDAVLDGVSNLNLNKPQKAYEDFNRAIEIDSTRANGYVGRANTLNTLGRYQEALKDYNKALEIDPKLANAYVNRGSAYSHMGQYQKAIADYEKGLELDPKIDDPPGFIKRLFSNEPDTDKGIRKHLEFLKQKVKDS
ncbi:MAG: tetratricopeptide repeat protein [Desulfobacterales bacterium]|nr:tetratricopeptide repeat protein [Desulfobacterales bacterium]